MGNWLWCKIKRSEEPCEILDSSSDDGDDAISWDEDIQGYTPFHFAAWKGNCDRVTHYLPRQRAEIDAKTNDLNTPFALAAHGGHVEVFKLLLKHGADVNNSDHEQDTPLHYAIKNKSLIMVQLLIQHGANVSVKNCFNITPIWISVYYRDVSILKLLLFHYADMQISAKGCGDATNHAVAYNEPRSPLYVAIDRKAFDCVNVLLQAGYEVHKEKWLREADYPSGSSSTDEKANTQNHDMIAIVKQLKELSSKPPTLLSLCRTFLRKHLGYQLNDNVDSFNLPPFLAEYLTLSHFDTDKQRKGSNNEKMHI